MNNYYSIKEAAMFLSKEAGEEISERSVLELAARGEIRVCAWFDGLVELFRHHYPDPVRVDFFQT